MEPVPDTASPLDTPSGNWADDAQIAEYVDLVRRRWRWIVTAGLLALVLTWGYQRTRVSLPIYTAEVLVQRLPEQASAALGLRGADLAPVQGIASEMQILRARRILGEVVDSVGLRLTTPGSTVLRSQVLDDVVVLPDAASRLYVLERNGETIRLLAGGQTVATADELGEIQGPAFQLRVVDPLEIPEEGLQVRVVPRRDAVDRLLGSMDTEQPSLTNLIRIRYTDLDPVLAANVANHLARAYQEQAASRAREEARRQKVFLADRLASVTDSLRVAQELLLEFQAESSTLNPEAEGQTLSGMLMSANEELRGLRSERQILEELAASFDDAGRQSLRQITVLGQEALPGAADLLDRLQGYQDQRTNLISVSRRTEGSPDVQLLDSLIQETRAELRLTVEQALELARQRVASSEQYVGELQEQVGSVPARNVAFSRFEQRVEAIQRMHDLLATRFYEAQIAEAVEAGDVQIVDPALVPEEPSRFTRRSIHPLTALVAGLFLGFVGVVLHHRLDTRIRTADDVRRNARCGILGYIPRIEVKDKSERPIAKGIGPMPREAFRMLRTNLRFSRAEELGCIELTSPGPGEGKTMISANLALVFADERRSVLLIDADLRRPMLHTVFGLDKEPGLSNILVGEKIERAVHRTEGGLYVLTAGSSVPNPVELLGSSSFQSLLQNAREQFDIIVIDTPPVLAVSDASVIAPLVDGTVIVARRGQTHRGALEGATNQLRRSGTPVLGAVVNDLEVGAPYYGSGAADGGYYLGYGAADYLGTAEDNGKPSRGGRRFRVPFGSGK